MSKIKTVTRNVIKDLSKQNNLTDYDKYLINKSVIKTISYLIYYIFKDYDKKRKT